MSNIFDVYLADSELEVIEGLVRGELTDYGEAVSRLGLSKMDVAQGAVRYVSSPDYDSDLQQVLSDLNLTITDILKAACVLDEAESDPGGPDDALRGESVRFARSGCRDGGFLQTLVRRAGDIVKEHIKDQQTLIDCLLVLASHPSVCEATRACGGAGGFVPGAGYRDRFIDHLVRLFGSDLDSRPHEVSSEASLEILLWCCGLIPDRGRLGPPLLRMYDRASQGVGRWARPQRQVRLRECLSHALIANQPYRTVATGDTHLDEEVRPRLEEAWFSLLEAGKDKVLLGSEQVGFGGVLNLDSPNEADLIALGRALDAMVQATARGPLDRTQELGAALERIRDRHAVRVEAVNAFLFVHSRKVQWPEWAASAVPRSRKSDHWDIAQAIDMLVRPSTAIDFTRDECFPEYSNTVERIVGSEYRMVLLAHEGGWPASAVDRLPNLWIEPGHAGNDTNNCIVWKPLWQHLDAYVRESGHRRKAELVDTYCGDRVVAARIDEDLRDLFSQIARCFETRRRDTRISDKQRGDITATLASNDAELTPGIEDDWVVRQVFPDVRKDIRKGVYRRRNEQNPSNRSSYYLSSSRWVRGSRQRQRSTAPT
jgi:hypothetical protein